MDQFRKSKSLYSSTANSFGTGEAVTITPGSVAGLPTDTEIVLTFDRQVDGKLERIRGTVTGSNFVVSSGGRGEDGTTEQSHTSPIVELIPNAADINDVVDGLLVEHAQDGSHTDITADSITLAAGATPTEFSTDTTMAGNSDTAIPTEKAVKTYVDGKLSQTTTASSATPTPTGNAERNELYITALAAAAELQAPSGTPINGNILVVRIKDNGTARALTYNAIYRGIVDTLPSTTTLSKTIYMGFKYNSADSKWDMLSVAEEE